MKKYPELQSFFNTYIAGSDADAEEQSVRSFIDSSTSEKQTQVMTQAQNFSASPSLVEALGMEANRWFGDAEEAQAWLEKISTLIANHGGNSDTDTQTVTKDSNGAVLNEDDSVTVIKDLKVKGGSSDLKRGTLIRKIHLIGDPDNIECNVNGSTLVLKTCFLKKA